MLLSAFGALADSPPDDPNCSTVDLNASETSPLRRLPIYDQDGSATCYAYASSTLINYELALQGKPSADFVNPAYAAWVTNYNDSDLLPSATTDHGYLANTVDRLKEEKNCPASKVEECLTHFKSLGEMTDGQLLHFLDVLYDNYQSYALPRLLHRFFGKDDSFEKTVEKTAQDIWVGDRCTATSLPEELKSEDLFGIPETLVMKELFAACPKNQRQKLILPEFEPFMDGPSSVFKQKIDASLNRSRPVALNICSEVLDEPYIRIIDDNPRFIARRSLWNRKGQCSPHSVVVSGRKMINGSCSYLIRNSWGPWWHPAEALTCSCLEQGGFYDDNCTDAHVVIEYLGCWYKSEDLLLNTTETFRFLGS